MIHSVQQNNTNHLMTLQSTQASHAKDTDDLRGKYKMLQISINGSEREAFVMGSQLDGVQSEFYLWLVVTSLLMIFIIHSNMMDSRCVNNDHDWSAIHIKVSGPWVGISREELQDSSSLRSTIL